MKKTLKKSFGDSILEIRLDKSQVYPEDPGMGAPAMVILLNKSKRELDSGTYWCAIGESELSYNGTRLSEEQVDWLFSQQMEIENFLKP